VVAAQLTLIILSLLLLMAHFLRSGSVLLLFGAFVVLVMLAARRPWAARVAQVTLVLGALEWIRTLVSAAGARMRAGEPVARLAIILGVVAAVTAAAAVMFETKRLRRVFGFPEDGGSGDGS